MTDSLNTTTLIENSKFVMEKPKGKRVFITTHGCQMNEYDSARMLDLLKQKESATVVETPELADILLLNTCSIREKAQEKKIQILKLLLEVALPAKKALRSAKELRMSM